MTSPVEPIWHPDAERLERASLTRLMRRCGVADYEDLRAFALRDLDAYWREVAADLGVPFRTPFDRVLDDSAGPEWPRWFAGGEMNFTDMVLGAEGERDADVALIGYAEGGAHVELTRADLRREVAAAMSRLAAAGLAQGDRVALLLPNIVEAAFVMIAAARMGAIVVPLYSAFGPEAITTRINAAGARMLVTCDGYLRGGKTILTAPVIDAVAASCPTVETVAVVDCLGSAGTLGGGDKARRWSDLPADREVEAPALDPNTPWMIMFTSGTTGRPKGTVHTHGGFPIRLAHDTAYQFDFQAGDRLFWYSDMGWMIGPLSVCAPLMLGGALVLYNGGPTTPDALQLLRVAKDAGVTHFGTAPTVLRMMRAAFPEVPKDLAGNFKVMMTAGEVIDEPTFRWAHDEIGAGKTPIINYTGGTEVSGGILSNIVVRPIYPMGFNAAVTDVDVALFDDTAEAPVGMPGEVVLRRPMLGMTQGLWQEPERYLEGYWSKRPGVWSHGDLAIRHTDTLWELRGRSDDVLKISGRRVGPTEIEDAALSEGSVAIAAAVGVPDPKSGQAVVLLVVPKAPEDALRDDYAEAIRAHVAKKLGAGLRPRQVLVVPDLPRTRNSKILRRLAKSVVLDEPLGDASTLENPQSLDSLRVIVAGGSYAEAVAAQSPDATNPSSKG
jgi:acetyl-CoA synthetase